MTEKSYPAKCFSCKNPDARALDHPDPDYNSRTLCPDCGLVCGSPGNVGPAGSLRFEQRKTDVELTCRTCPQNPPFPPPNKVPTGFYYVRVWTESGREDPMCWDCYDELF